MPLVPRPAYGAGGSSIWMMSGIGIPNRSTRILKVMPVVSSCTVSSVRRRVAVSGPRMLWSFCANLMTAEFFQN